MSCNNLLIHDRKMLTCIGISIFYWYNWFRNKQMLFLNLFPMKNIQYHKQIHMHA